MALAKALSFPGHKPFKFDVEVELPKEFVYEPSEEEDPDATLLDTIYDVVCDVMLWTREDDHWDTLDDKMEKDLAAIRPTLPKGASKKKCVAAIDEYKRQYVKLVQSQRKDFADLVKPRYSRSGGLQKRIDELKEEVAEHMVALKAEEGEEPEEAAPEEEDDENRVYYGMEGITEVYEEDPDEDWDSEADMDEDRPFTAKETLVRMRRRLRKWELHLGREERLDICDVEKHSEITARRAHDFFLKNVLEMVKDHSDLKDWISHSSTGHLDKKEAIEGSSRLMTERSGSGSTALPWEISALIYSYCDLETCVNLRQASAAWYNAYQHAERALELNVQERYPWMRPEEEMETWGDCALVFVGRNQNDKWETLIDFFMCGLSEEYEPRTLLAEELPHGEKLPDNFQGLHEHHDDNLCSEECEMVHLCMNNSDGIDAVLNPWTLESRYMEEEKWSLVSSNKKENVVKYRDVVVTLPGKVLPIKDMDDGRIELLGSPFTLNRHSIVVRTMRDGTFMFPREKPHFHDALNFADDEGSIELEHIFIIRFTSDFYRVDFSFCDPIAKDLHLFASLDAEYEPVAFYQGLIWWYARGHISPTYFGITKSPQFRKDRSFKVAFGDHQKFRQCSRAPHLIVRNLDQAGQGIELADLSTGIVTQVNAPGEGYVLPGYVDGKFVAKFMSYDTLEEYAIELEKKKKRRKARK